MNYINIRIAFWTLTVFMIIFGSMWLYANFMNHTSSKVTYSFPLPASSYKPATSVWGQEFTSEDVNCLALNIYFEARGEPTKGQHAVAEVVIWRFMHANYPDSICEVVRDGQYYHWNPDLPVRDRCQFSWWCDGKSDKAVDGTAFETALNISKQVLQNPAYDTVIEYALFYHADYVDPYWVDSVTFVDRIGVHSFYR